MTPTQLQNFLDNKIQYKNAFFKVKRDNISDFVWIKMYVKVKDACSSYSYNQSQEILLITTESVTEWHLNELDEHKVLHLIYNMIRRLELHEIDEHFKVNNKHFKDPHPENKVLTNNVNYTNMELYE